jgi:hypothetical protein
MAAPIAIHCLCNVPVFTFYPAVMG